MFYIFYGLFNYEGYWKNDKFNGHGTLYNEQGLKIYQGNFENNKKMVMVKNIFMIMIKNMSMMVIGKMI